MCVGGSVCTIHGVNAFNIIYTHLYTAKQYDGIASTGAFVLAKEHVYPIPTINHLKSFVVELRRYIIRRQNALFPWYRASD